jgi:hypothetical protein
MEDAVVVVTDFWLSIIPSIAVRNRQWKAEELDTGIGDLQVFNR